MNRTTAREPSQLLSAAVAKDRDAAMSSHAVVGRASRDLAMTPATMTLALVVVLALSVAPILVAEYPPLNDYPFHLARVRIIEAIGSGGFHGGYYDLRSFLIPNIAMDVVVLGMSRVMSLETAGRVFLVVTQALTLLGSAWLHRAATGRSSLWPLVASLFLHNWILLFGFLNFQFGLAVMLWGLGTWIRIRQARVAVRLLVGAAIAIVLFFCHMLALAFNALTIASIELQHAYERRNDPWRAAVDLIAGGAAFVPPGILFLVSATFAGGSGSGVTFKSEFWWKPYIFARHFMSANLWLDAVTAIACVAVLVMLLAGARLRIARDFRFAIVVLAVAFLALPFGFFTAQHLDIRVPMVLWFVVVSTLDVRIEKPSMRTAIVATLAVLAVLRAAGLVNDWRMFDRQYAVFVRALDRLPAGSTLMVSTAASPAETLGGWIGRWRPQITHVASLASIRGAVFVPAIWAHHAQQPIVVKPAYKPLYELQANNPVTTRDTDALQAFGREARELHRAATTATAAGVDRPLMLLLLYPKELAGAPPPWKVVARDELFTLFDLSAE